MEWIKPVAGEAAMEYYAKSENLQGHQETVKEHLQKVAALAREYGEALGLADAAGLEGLVHDFGKYTKAFQDVWKGKRTGVDHAISGACFLECCYRGRPGSRPVIEAVNGHHAGLVAYDMIKAELHAIADDRKQAHGNAGKTPSIENAAQLKEANAAFQKDFLISDCQSFRYLLPMNWNPCCIPDCCFPVWWMQTTQPLQ